VCTAFNTSLREAPVEASHGVPIVLYVIGVLITVVLPPLLEASVALIKEPLFNVVGTDLNGLLKENISHSALKLTFFLF
jgi:hypothetical protein